MTTTEPRDETFICDLDECPVCGEQWAYTLPKNRRFSHVVAIYSRDKDATVAWLCPGCKTEWPRNATVAVVVSLLEKDGDQ